VPICGYIFPATPATVRTNTDILVTIDYDNSALTTFALLASIINFTFANDISPIAAAAAIAVAPRRPTLVAVVAGGISTTTNVAVQFHPILP
jgi:hypothetical protein